MTQVIEKIGGEYENRTRVHGFAIRCVTTPPTRRLWFERALATNALWINRMFACCPNASLAPRQWQRQWAVAGRRALWHQRQVESDRKSLASG
jgi:hypothetical protein